MQNTSAEDRDAHLRHNDVEERSGALDAARDATEQLEAKSTLYTPERSERLRAEAEIYRSERS